MCSHLDIKMWKFKDGCDNSYECYMRLKDFKRFIKVVRKTRSKFIICEKHGLPFFLYGYKKRIPLFAGMVTSFFLMIYMSTYIWDINLIGNYSYTPSEILSFLEEKGIVHGMKKSRVNSEEIEKIIRNNYFDITWVSVEISGTRMNIHIKENFDNFIVKNEEMPYSLVASKDGEITSIVTRSGTPKVKAGDMVKAGDVLVSGAVDVFGDNGEVINTVYVNADADIMARTVHEYEYSLNLTHAVKEYTGKTRRKYGISIFNRYISINMPGRRYAEYDIVTEEKTLKCGDGFYLPISFNRGTYREFKTEEITYGEEEALLLAEKHLELFRQKILKNGAFIESENIEGALDASTYSAKGIVTVVENISKTDSDILKEQN